MARAKRIYILKIIVSLFCCYSFGILCFSREKTGKKNRSVPEKRPCVKKKKEMCPGKCVRKKCKCTLKDVIDKRLLTKVYSGPWVWNVIVVQLRAVQSLQVQEPPSLKMLSGMISHFWWNYFKHISYSAIVISQTSLSDGLQDMWQWQYKLTLWWVVSDSLGNCLPVLKTF